MYFLYILLAVLILLMMVTIHEFGHYIAGRILGFKIVEFSIGFGPVLLQRVNKRGEKISLRAFPLGGYCAFYGEDGPGGDADADKNKADGQVFEEYAAKSDKVSTPVNDGAAAISFEKHKPWKRIIVLSAGALFNLLSGVVFSFIYLLSVGYLTPAVSQVYDTPNKAIIQAGDIIVAVDGKEISHLNSATGMLGDFAQGEEFSLTVIRDGQRTDLLKLSKAPYEYTDEDGKTQTLIGVGIGLNAHYTRTGFFRSLGQAVPFTARMGGLVLKVFGGIFTGENLKDVTGPIGTINSMAQISSQNLLNVLILLPAIAVNLGLFNLFPIPALDGSKIVFTTLEWIRKKPINQKVENIIHFVGFVLLFALVFAIDIIHFFMRIT